MKKETEKSKTKAAILKNIGPLFREKRIILKHEYLNNYVYLVTENYININDLCTIVKYYVSKPNPIVPNPSFIYYISIKLQSEASFKDAQRPKEKDFDINFFLSKSEKKDCDENFINFLKDEISELKDIAIEEKMKSSNEYNNDDNEIINEDNNNESIFEEFIQ